MAIVLEYGEPSSGKEKQQNSDVAVDQALGSLAAKLTEEKRQDPESDVDTFHIPEAANVKSPTEPPK